MDAARAATAHAVRHFGVPMTSHPLMNAADADPFETHFDDDPLTVAVGRRDVGSGSRLFKIRPADNQGRRQAASALIDRMYSRKGYETGFLAAPDEPGRITLVASDGGETLGTLSLGIDTPAGLQVDALYRDEIDMVRARGRRVCELTKLAIDQQLGSKRVLASLFHTAYIYGRLLNRVTDVFIEVNPRHAPFYRRMLGFVQCGEERICPRVNAPAVLLRLELDYVDRQIHELGGLADEDGDRIAERSLYPYFFSKREESGIARRLLELGQPCEVIERAVARPRRGSRHVRLGLHA